MSQIIIHTDGASRGNPGPAAIAYVIEGLADKAVTFSKAIGSTTNNQAEYQALVAALEYLVEQTVSNSMLHFIADSELMVRQINGQYKVKDLLLKPVFLSAKSLISKLEAGNNSCVFESVPRAENKQADALANYALDNS